MVAVARAGLNEEVARVVWVNVDIKRPPCWLKLLGLG